MRSGRVFYSLRGPFGTTFGELWEGFGGLVASIWSSGASRERAKAIVKTSQMSSGEGKSAQGCSKSAQDALKRSPRGLQEASKRPPRGLQEASKRLPMVSKRSPMGIQVPWYPASWCHCIFVIVIQCICIVVPLSCSVLV